MTESENATKESAKPTSPTHVDGTGRGEEMGEDPTHVDLGEMGAGRPVGGRAAFDPKRVGQDKVGMKERGTIDPDAPDPSGGPA